MKIENWNDAADDIYSYLKERERTYNLAKMLKVVDTLAMKDNVAQSELAGTITNLDFVATVLGLVTMAVHGKGSVPKPPNGWYSKTGGPPTYSTHPLFAAAWRRKRKL